MKHEFIYASVSWEIATVLLIAPIVSSAVSTALFAIKDWLLIKSKKKKTLSVTLPDGRVVNYDLKELTAKETRYILENFKDGRDAK